MRSITIQTKLDETFLSLKMLKEFLGKNVIVTVIETPIQEPPQTRLWDALGDLDLGGKLDDVNIRDYAHD